MNKGGGEAAKVLAAAPGKTRAAHTAKVSMSVAVGSRSVIRVDGIGRLDRERARLHFIYDVPVGGLPAGTKAVGVIHGDDLYIRLENKPAWVHVPDSTGDTSFSTGFGESLDYLSAVIGNPKFVGKDTVRGAPARVYSATVDLDRVADNLPRGQRAAYRKKRVEHGLAARLPLKVAIDDQGRIARMEYQATVQGAHVVLHVEMYGFGVKGNFSTPKHFVESGG